MANTKEELMDQLEWRTQECAVLITDTKETSYGSGVLYYPKDSSRVYVFTCAHVLDELTETFVIRFFVPVNREIEDYTVHTAMVNRNQVVYSPRNVITEENGNKRHSEDVAVLFFDKEEGWDITVSEYGVAEAYRGNLVFTQGFPNGTAAAKELLEALDTAHGKVLHSIPSSNNFVFRLEDAYLDSSNRVYELQGFSGSAVWNGENEVPSVLGLLSSGVGETVYRGRINAVKMSVIRNIMETHFYVHMDTCIAVIPESDVAGENRYAGYAMQDTEELPETLYDKWLVLETEKVRAYIDDSKIEKAIAIAKEAMQNSYFEKCSKKRISIHLKHLLYCYESALLEEEYLQAEQYMREHGLIEEHDPLRWMSYNFSRRNFAETKEYAEKILETEESDTTLGIMARLYATISKAYTDNAPVEETLLMFLDEKEQLKEQIQDPAACAIIYQMSGYVYGEFYREYTKAVRCLNRAYRIGHDSAVLESLSGAYYFLALEGAIGSDDLVKEENINIAELNKARECFLLLMEQEDDLLFTATIKRVGLAMFNTFYFLHDTYRVLTLYPKIKENICFEDKKLLRDFEWKYARTRCQLGRMDLSQFEALNERDCLMFETVGSIREFTMLFEGVPPQSLYGNTQVSNHLFQLLSLTEQRIDHVEERDKLPLMVELFNLYGFGHRCFQWEVTKEMQRLLDKIKESAEKKLITALENFLFENSNPVEMAEKRFIESYEKSPSRELWVELLHFYIRNGWLDKADKLYEDLFYGKNAEQILKNSVEYACRGYIDYVIHNQRNIKNALNVFVNHKSEMKDLNLRNFLEHELMIYTCSFNEPELFEEERYSFVQQGFVPIEEYHRIILVAYMCNLDSQKSWEHFNTKNLFFGVNIQRPGYMPYLTKEGAQFLVWQRKYPPHKEENWNGIMEKNLHRTLEIIRSEAWHQDVEVIKERVNYKLERCIALDAWAIYIIVCENCLDTLEKFDCVYVTHSTITRMMEEMTHYENIPFTVALAYLEELKNLKLLSPDFEHQLQVREIATPYWEPCSTIAMALEKKCIAVLGEPKLQKELMDTYKDSIVRACDYGSL